MKQEINKSSMGVQIENVNIQTISKSEIKDIVEELFWKNFLKIKEDTRLIIEEKLKDFSNKFFEHISQINNINIERLKTPDLQYIFYKSEENFVRCDDVEKQNMIVNMLVSRIMADNESLFQLNLNQAIEIIPRLNLNHITILTLAFVVQELINKNINNIDLLKLYLYKEILPFLNCSVTKNNLRYLMYCGCGSVLIGNNFGKILTIKYPELFQVQKSTKLKEIGEEENILIDGKIITVREYITSLDSNFKRIFEVYDDTNLYTFNTTSVASLIGAFNYNLKTDIKIPVEKWFV